MEKFVEIRHNFFVTKLYIQRNYLIFKTFQKVSYKSLTSEVKIEKVIYES